LQLSIKKPTRNGDKEIAIFTHLPPDVATPAVVLSSFLKQPRAPKKKKDPRHPHVSTAKLLAMAKKSP
jgi:hypothetical protein